MVMAPKDLLTLPHIQNQIAKGLTSLGEEKTNNREKKIVCTAYIVR